MPPLSLCALCSGLLCSSLGFGFQLCRPRLGLLLLRRQSVHLCQHLLHSNRVGALKPRLQAANLCPRPRQRLQRSLLRRRGRLASGALLLWVGGRLLLLLLRLNLRLLLLLLLRRRLQWLLLRRRRLQRLLLMLLLLRQAFQAKGSSLWRSYSTGWARLVCGV